MKGEEPEIKQLNNNDLLLAQQLFMLLQEVFEIKKSAALKKSYLKKLLANPAFVCFAAIYKNEVIGGLTAYLLPMYDIECAEMFIYDIAVKPAFQRIGVGKSLLSAAQDYGKQNGIKTMFVNAGEEDLHALDFYRSMGGRAEGVVQFTFLI